MRRGQAPKCHFLRQSLVNDPMGRYMPRMQTAHEHDNLTFMKMHGAGNDFVIIDSRGRGAVAHTDLVRALGDRHRGVGFDQLAEIRDTQNADIALDFWNADGSRSGACGNATRCVAAFVLAESGATAMTIETPRGVLAARRGNDGVVSVNMGLPQLDWRDIPLAREADIDALPLPGRPAAVGMGNPHCIFFVTDADAADVAGEGARFEHDPLFPEATNVEFVSRSGPDRLRMRVWERGTGITLACGSGACAVAVAAHRRGLAGRWVEIEADGGLLGVAIREDGVWLSGPVAHVFDGRLSHGFPEEV